MENCRVTEWYKCSWCNSLNEKVETIDVSEQSCNLDCEMCRSSIYVNKQGLDNYFRVLDSLRGLGIDSIHLTCCGEPFLDKKRTFDYLESLTKGKDFNRVEVISNLTTLDKEDILELKQIHENNIPLLIFGSIDGITPETYKKVRRKNCFDKVLENAKLLYDAKLLVGINYVVVEDNLKEIPLVKNFYKKMGMENLHIQFLRCESQNLPKFSNKRDIIENSKEMMQLKKQNYGEIL